MEDIPSLIFTEKVIKETLRLYPPAWSVARTAINEFELDGYQIPGGSNIVMSQWIMHRDSRFFPDPDKSTQIVGARQPAKPASLRLLPVWWRPEAMRWRFVCADRSPAGTSDGGPEISARTGRPATCSTSTKPHVASKGSNPDANRGKMLATIVPGNF